MCRGCTLTEKEALTLTKLECKPCPYVTRLPPLPQCTELTIANCPNLLDVPALPACTVLHGTGSGLRAIPPGSYQGIICRECPNLASVPPVPHCTVLFCGDCPQLQALPDLPAVTHLNCSNCPQLARIGATPKLRIFNCERCTSLIELPALPAGATLNCVGCTQLRLVHDVPAVHYLQGTYLEGVTEFTPQILARPYRCRYGPMFQRWRERVSARNYRILFPLIRTYPALRDVLPRLV